MNAPESIEWTLSKPQKKNLNILFSWAPKLYKNSFRHINKNALEKHKYTSVFDFKARKRLKSMELQNKKKNKNKNKRENKISSGAIQTKRLCSNISDKFDQHLF